MSEEGQALEQHGSVAAARRPGRIFGRLGSDRRLLVGGVALLVVLGVVGALLPPLSLAHKLGLVAGPAAAPRHSLPGEISLSPDDPAQALTVSAVPRDAFLSGAAGDEWAAVAGALPENLSLVGSVYAIEHDGNAAPSGRARLSVPAGAPPAQALDLYSWDGAAWAFTPSQVEADGAEVVSAAGPYPVALGLLQAADRAEPAVVAELLPAQELPADVLPLLTDISAGTLTLSQDGALLGEAVAPPAGDQRAWLRATNTGAVVDSVSLGNLLVSTDARQTNIRALVEQAAVGDYAGVNLDYQGVGAAQREAFSAFVAELAAALHGQDKLLAVTLETPLQTSNGWDTAGQDWASVGRSADAVLAQLPLDPAAYANDGPADQLLAWATRQVSRAKLHALLSVNAIDGVGQSLREVSPEQAVANFGQLTLTAGSPQLEPGQAIELALSGSAGKLEWDAASLSYKYSYEEVDQTHTVWLTSEALLAQRSRLAGRHNLAGLAVRGLGNVADGAGYAAALESYLGAADAPQPASAAIVWALENADGAVIDSGSGDAFSGAWQAPEEPGDYVVSAELAQGQRIASLGQVALSVKSPATPTAEASPTPTAEPTAEASPTPEPTAEATAEPEVAPATDPGEADLIANTDVNVREGPGLGYAILTLLRAGQTADLIGRNEAASWLQVELNDGSQGWLFGDLVTVNDALDLGGVAVVEVEPPEPPSGGNGGGGGAPPPVIPPAAGGSFELGGQTHTLANPSLMGLAGMNWVKFQHKWSPGDSPDAVAGRIGQAHANGFKVLLSIPGATVYPGSIDFGGYVEFLRGVAALGPNAIEVWNEENIDFEWPAGQINPASYVNNMLAPAYNAIKSANGSVMVISGAPAPTGFDNGTNAWSDARYMAGMAAAGGGSYMDCVGVHYNAGATSPNATSGHPGGGHYSWYFWPTLNLYYNAFGGARPVCFTELGFLSGEDFGGVPSRFSWAAGTSVGEHAQWLAEAASLSANSGRVRMMIIFNVDFTVWGDDPQAGYAILRPNGSCPACDLLAQVMG
ncbi:MAG: SH3 domain-containing protein [Candidatus Promineifilaceae bacterium]